MLGKRQRGLVCKVIDTAIVLQLRVCKLTITKM